MAFFLHPSTVTIIAHTLIVMAITVRVIKKRPATGVALAWLLFVAAVPFAGAVIYLLIGEHRIGQQRAKRIAALRTDFKQITDAAFREGTTEVDWSRRPRSAAAVFECSPTHRKFSSAPGSSRHRNW
jgi:cardiolipin synthase